MDRAKIAELEADLSMITLQFVSYNAGFVPTCVPPKPKTEGSVRAVAQKPGKQILSTDKNDKTNIKTIPLSLERKDWMLRNAFFEERFNSQEQKKFWVVRFVIVRREGGEVNPNIKGIEPQLWNVLCDFCQKSWHIRIFDNPFFLNGVEIPNKRTLMIECNGRQDPSESDFVLLFNRRKLYLQKG